MNLLPHVEILWEQKGRLTALRGVPEKRVIKKTLTCSFWTEVVFICLLFALVVKSLLSCQQPRNETHCFTLFMNFLALNAIQNLDGFFESAAKICSHSRTPHSWRI